MLGYKIKEKLAKKLNLLNETSILVIIKLLLYA